MEWQRFWRHIRMTRWQAARMFPPRSLDAIEAAIRAGETHHRGEVRFIVEAELATDDLLRGISTRQRAGVLFARERVWDTEANTGVLIYVALGSMALKRAPTKPAKALFLVAALSVLGTMAWTARTHRVPF